SKRVIAGCRISASASSRTAKNAASAISDASTLGSPQPASLSASGARMIVSTSAVTSGRNTTEPIERTKGRARNSRRPISRTSVEISRSSCSAKAVRRNRRTGGTSLPARVSGGTSVMRLSDPVIGCCGALPLRGRAIKRSPRRRGLAAAGRHVVEFLENRTMRDLVLDRTLRDRAVLEHGVERGARAANAALDRADRATADRRRLFVGETARTDEQQRFAPFGRQGQQCAVHVGQVD